MAVQSFMVPLGTPLPDFSLPTIDSLLGGETQVVRAQDFAAAPALLVVFVCNHCPYVRHIENAFTHTLAAFPELAVVGISSNDAVSYPEDSPAGLAAQRDRAGWRFPYLFDESQDIARAFKAAATPDFFLFNAERTLVYRGAFDESTPSSGKPLTGELLANAIRLTLAGRPVPEPHIPSIGCSIKFRD